MTRFATFNASLTRHRPGLLRAELATAVRRGIVSPQLDAVLRIIGAVDPDVLLVNELDTGTDGDPTAVGMFARLAGYRHWFTAPSNTGVPSGLDLDGDGVVAGPGDAFGFGAFPGQFGMAVFSKHPVDTVAVRTFQTFRWADLPGARLPVDPATGGSWYSPEALAVVRLSSKSHWDVPIELGGGRTVHLLASHPTPPAYDGPEARNRRRNADEIRFWADYITPGGASGDLYDDGGRRGGLDDGASFVVAGDLNADPLDGGSVPGAAQQLVDHPRVNSASTPVSDGAAESARHRGGANLLHRSDARADTAEFDAAGPGNLRVDYVLASSDLRVSGGAVFWPLSGAPGSEWTGGFPSPSSDHRLVHLDVQDP